MGGFDPSGATAFVLLLGDYLAKRFDTWSSERKLKQRLQTAEDALNKALRNTREGRISENRLVAAIHDVEEAFAMLDESRIINATNIIPLQWFRAHHRELRSRWLGNG